MKYYQVDAFPIDEKIIGKSDSPYTISIESKDFQKYILDKMNNIYTYFKNQSTLYKDMPDYLEGKLLRRKRVINFMHVSPFCFSLLAVIDNKMQHILEKLNVSRDEYVLKRISVKGFIEDFYLLFVPLIPDSELVFPKCIFREMFGANKIKTFGEYDELIKDGGNYYTPKVTLPYKYKNYDLIWPQRSSCFFSERVINAMQEENVVGYNITTGGVFYSELYFASE